MSHPRSSSISHQNGAFWSFSGSSFSDLSVFFFSAAGLPVRGGWPRTRRVRFVRRKRRVCHFIRPSHFRLSSRVCLGGDRRAVAVLSVFFFSSTFTRDAKRAWKVSPFTYSIAALVFLTRCFNCSLNSVALMWASASTHINTMMNELLNSIVTLAFSSARCTYWTERARCKEEKTGPLASRLERNG